MDRRNGTGREGEEDRRGQPADAERDNDVQSEPAPAKRHRSRPAAFSRGEGRERGEEEGKKCRTFQRRARPSVKTERPPRRRIGSVRRGRGLKKDRKHNRRLAATRHAMGSRRASHDEASPCRRAGDTVAL